jgi:hypothetical protein
LENDPLWRNTSADALLSTRTPRLTGKLIS